MKVSVTVEVGSTCMREQAVDISSSNCALSVLVGNAEEDEDDNISSARRTDVYMSLANSIFAAGRAARGEREGCVPLEYSVMVETTLVVKVVVIVVAPVAVLVLHVYQSLLANPRA